MFFPQVILSFLDGNAPDWDSCHAAYAAYMRPADILQDTSHSNISQQHWKCSADQLAADIAVAQAAEDTSAAVTALLQKYPRSSAMTQLQAAVHNVRHRLRQEDEIDIIQLSYQGKTATTVSLL